MRANTPEILNLGDYLVVFRRRWVSVLIPVVVLPWAAFAYSSSQPDEFQATAEVLLGDTAAEEAIASGSQNITFRDRLLENEVRLATGDAADRELARRFADEVPPAVVTAQASADVLEFTAVAQDPESAANIANAWAETYLFLKEDATQASIGTTIVQLEDRLSDLQAERTQVRSRLLQLESELAGTDPEDQTSVLLEIDRESSQISGPLTLIDAQISATAESITDLRLSSDLALGSGPRIVTAAVAPFEPIGTSPLLFVVLGLVVGAISGTSIALLREGLDDVLRTSNDLAKYDLGHLGSVPRASKAERSTELALASLESPQSPQAAAYQKVRSSLDFIASDRDLRSIAITSAVQSEGKTTTAANIATALAQASKKTILIDLDLRRPRLHKVFRIKQTPGVTDVVIDQSSLPESAWPIPSLAESLVVIPAGKLPPHASSFISTEAFSSTIKSLKKLGEFIVFDAPPVLPVADTLAIGKQVDGVILVVSAGQTKGHELQSTIDSLQNAGASVIGAVLVGVKDKRRGYEYRYETEDDVDWLSPADASVSKRPIFAERVIDLRDKPENERDGNDLDSATSRKGAQ